MSPHWTRTGRCTPSPSNSPCTCFGMQLTGGCSSAASLKTRSSRGIPPIVHRRRSPWSRKNGRRSTIRGGIALESAEEPTESDSWPLDRARRSGVLFDHGHDRWLRTPLAGGEAKAAALLDEYHARRRRPLAATAVPPTQPDRHNRPLRMRRGYDPARFPSVFDTAHMRLADPLRPVLSGHSRLSTYIAGAVTWDFLRAYQVALARHQFVWSAVTEKPRT